MTTKTVSAFFYPLLLAGLLASCAKEHNNDIQADLCTKLTQLHTHSFTPVTKGGTIRLSADSLSDAYYQWTGPGNFSSDNQNPSVSDYADYSDAGWYHVSISLDGCSTTYDSVYVEVKFPQGTPNCSLANNQATFSSLGDQAYYFVSFGPGTTGYEIEGNSSNGDLRITMSNYYSAHALPDGIYYTTSDPLPDDADLDKIFIANVNQSIYWVAEENKPVYVSHVGGKARVSFCNISFSGDWGGTLYHTIVSAQVTQP